MVGQASLQPSMLLSRLKCRVSELEKDGETLTSRQERALQQIQTLNQVDCLSAMIACCNVDRYEEFQHLLWPYVRRRSRRSARRWCSARMRGCARDSSTRQKWPACATR